MSQARLFREEWVERQRAGARPGELVRHARWMRRATLILVASVAACVVAASRVSVAQSLQLPAVVTGQTAVASLTGAGAPRPVVGERVVYYPDGAGGSVHGRVVVVGATAVRAVLAGRASRRPGRLVISLPSRSLLAVLAGSFTSGGGGG